MKGVFQGWVEGKPYGFISPDDGSSNVFVHENQVTTHRKLTAGMVVEFDTVQRDRGIQAENIRIDVIARPRKPLTNRTIKANAEGVVLRWHDKGYGFIESDASSGNVFVHVTALLCGEHLAEGDIVKFDLTEGNKGVEAQNVEVIGWNPTKDALSNFADVGDYNWLFDLKALAQDEEWEYRETESSYPLAILRSYIRFTFQRLQEMSAGVVISGNSEFAAFNTGLVTENQEAIYGLFVQNPTSGRQPWRFKAFRKESDRDFIDYFGSNRPPLAEYFDDPADLLFDRRCELYVSIDHVLERIDRFPPSLKDNPYLARQLLLSAEALTKKRVYRNYKTAIPQYFRDRGGVGSIQLLLPLCLLQPAKADLALTVERSKEGNSYRGSTVLSLDMAYNNARLLAKPDTEWLKP